MKKHKISTKLLLWLLSVTVVIVLVSGTLIAYSAYQSEVQDWSDFVFSYARTASDYIDGDRIDGYAKSQKTDEYYDLIQSFLDNNVKDTNLLFYYVFVPYEDDYMFIWCSEVHCSSILKSV